jgi:integrase
MGHLGAFFRRIIEWEYPDAPGRAPVYASDVPIKDKPLPKFLDDAANGKFMAAARQLTDEFGRLAIEVLARTGMRKGELLGLTTDAVIDRVGLLAADPDRQKLGGQRLSLGNAVAISRLVHEVRCRWCGDSTTTATSRCTRNSKQ